MERLFLAIVNMSITASYVILFVLFIRLLLKKAPKKYAYALWSVVLFRLVCPVSFTAIFSIFLVKPFDMTVAQQEGPAALGYFPANIGTMEVPKATVGIPTLNVMINDSLPAALPEASANPLQLWIWIGAILWLAGMAALLMLGVIAYVRLKRHVATAVRLHGNVYEADGIRSPFILGIARPRIYLPFGLAEEERGYILRHENYHLRRKDHLVSVLSFAVLAVHWFNPLAWLAYSLMKRDMEMSCDEKVLSSANPGIAKAYSLSLLAFAANRRFSGGSPLAFGESGIRERIRNVLRFRHAPKRIALPAAVLCAAAVAACAANPVPLSIDGLDHGGDGRSAEEQRISEDPLSPYGSFAFDKQLYMNPLSSFIALDGFREYYRLTEERLTVGMGQSYDIRYEEIPLTAGQFMDGFMITFGDMPDISSYKERYQVAQTETRDSRFYRLYRMDDEWWLARFHHDAFNTGKSTYIWSIYRITKLDGFVPSRTVIDGNDDQVELFLPLRDELIAADGRGGFVDGERCYNITTESVKSSSPYAVFKCADSAASYLLYEGELFPLGVWGGGGGLASMAVADLDGDRLEELYYTYSFGSGLHRSLAAYFDPVDRTSVTFDFVRLNEETMVASDGGGGLALYEASLSESMDFAHFELEQGARIADIVHQDGFLSLKPVNEK